MAAKAVAQRASEADQRSGLVAGGRSVGEPDDVELMFPLT